MIWEAGLNNFLEQLKQQVSRFYIHSQNAVIM